MIAIAWRCLLCKTSGIFDMVPPGRDYGVDALMKHLTEKMNELKRKHMNHENSLIIQVFQRMPT